MHIKIGNWMYKQNKDGTVTQWARDMNEVQSYRAALEKHGYTVTTQENKLSGFDIVAKPSKSNS